MAPVVALTVNVPLVGLEITFTVPGSSKAPILPGLSLDKVFKVTGVDSRVFAISVFATGGLFKLFGSVTVIVSVSVSQLDTGVCPGLHTGTSYSYTPGFVGVKV